jgi:GNAT superfamily N-acetyltransferase
VVAPTVLSASPDEAADLSALALRSKAVWGYDVAFLEACRAELTVTPDRIDGGGVLVAEDTAAGVLGFAAAGLSAPHGSLDMLFVEPTQLRRGVGAALLSAILERAREHGVQDLTLDADPGAEAFYLTAGAVRVGESPSGSIPGRTLPRLRLTVG